jgi:hypothetical protein
VFSYNYGFPNHQTVLESISLIGLNQSYLAVDPIYPFPDKPYALSMGKYDWNKDFYEENRAWKPGYPIMVQSPVDGATYVYNSVPAFAASAGSHTSELTWNSDRDGALGTGGTFFPPLLSPGEHTLIISFGVPPWLLPQEVAATATPFGQEVRHFTITAPPTTPLASANPVALPPDVASGPTTLTWSSPAYPLTDLYVSTNGGPLQFLAFGGYNGAFTTQVMRGTTAKFLILRRGSTNELAALSVSTVDSPFVKAVPNPVVISNGQLTGTTNLTWNAQQSSGQFDVRVSMDDAPSTLLSTTGSTGSSSATWIQADHIYRFTLHPHNNTSAVLATTYVFAQTSDTLFKDGFDFAR